MECRDPGEDDQGEDDQGEPGPGERGFADHDDYDHDAYGGDVYDQDADGRYGARYYDARTYWRRRFIVLAGGLAIVGGAMWGLAVAVGPARPPHGGKSVTVQDTLPPAALGAPASAPAASSASSAFPGASDSSGAAAASAGPSSRAASQDPACSPSAIVLSLFTTQARYGPGQEPQFEVYAVSTAPGRCTLAFGPSLVRVVVTQHGQVLWDSSSCPANAPAVRPVWFTQGVPRVAALSWNHKASAPGCAGSVPSRTGSVDAVALTDGRSSPVRSFILPG